jgi:hypothetical protein
LAPGVEYDDVVAKTAGALTDGRPADHPRNAASSDPRPHAQLGADLGEAITHGLSETRTSAATSRFDRPLDLARQVQRGTVGV